MPQKAHAKREAIAFITALFLLRLVVLVPCHTYFSVESHECARTICCIDHVLCAVRFIGLWLFSRDCMLTVINTALKMRDNATAFKMRFIHLLVCGATTAAPFAVDKRQARDLNASIQLRMRSAVFKCSKMRNELAEVLVCFFFSFDFNSKRYLEGSDRRAARNKRSNVYQKYQRPMD